MPMLRLAKVEDYEAHQIAGGVLYQVKWEEYMCPGSPTTDPAVGVHIYNDYITRCAAGTWPKKRTLEDAINWCLETPSIEAAYLALEVTDYIQNLCDFPMLPKRRYSSEYVQNRSRIFYARERVKNLPAHKILALKGRASEIRNGK